MKADAPRPQQPGADAIQARSGVIGRGETVLVVEDEHRLRRIIVGQLTALGFRVLEAGDGAAALEIMGKHPEVQVLYSDLVMPGGLSGLDLAKRALELYPEVRVILTTGYSELTGEAGAELDLQVLRKPYRQSELVCVFQEALKVRSAADDGPPEEGAPS